MQNVKTANKYLFCRTQVFKDLRMCLPESSSFAKLFDVWNIAGTRFWAMKIQVSEAIWWNMVFSFCFNLNFSIFAGEIKTKDKFIKNHRFVYG